MARSMIVRRRGWGRQGANLHDPSGLRVKSPFYPCSVFSDLVISEFRTSPSKETKDWRISRSSDTLFAFGMIVWTRNSSITSFVGVSRSSVLLTPWDMSSLRFPRFQHMQRMPWHDWMTCKWRWRVLEAMKTLLHRHLFSLGLRDVFPSRPCMSSCESGGT